MPGLKSTCPQLSLPVDPGGAARVWEMMSVEARERVLRLLASVIGRVVSGTESDQ
jgi:hypothetical protein